MKDKLVWPIVAVICASIIGTGLYFGLRDTGPEQPGQETLHEQTGGGQYGNEPSTDEITVYATRTGECYHRSTCGYLRASKIPMTLGEAKRRYRPCSRCRPPR